LNQPATYGAVKQNNKARQVVTHRALLPSLRNRRHYHAAFGV
jgi:hypothetical protein